jgi:hypothetical protein
MFCTAAQQQRPTILANSAPRSSPNYVGHLLVESFCDNFQYTPYEQRLSASVRRAQQNRDSPQNSRISEFLYIRQRQYLDQVSIVQNSLHYAYHPTPQPTQITLILSKALCLFLLLVKNAVCYLVERGDMEEVESGVLSSTESLNISFYALQTYSHKKCPYHTI